MSIKCATVARLIYMLSRGITLTISDIREMLKQIAFSRTGTIFSMEHP